MESPWWELKRQLHGRRKAAKKFNEFVVTATDGLGIEQCPAQPSRLKLRPAEPKGPGSQYSHLHATRKTVDADTIHIAPRETYIKNVLDILGLGDNKCKPMPTPIVQTRQKSDEDEPRLREEDRRAYHRRAGTPRHLLKYRPDTAFAVHEVSKTLHLVTSRAHRVFMMSQECIRR